VINISPSDEYENEDKIETADKNEPTLAVSAGLYGHIKQLNRLDDVLREMSYYSRKSIVFDKYCGYNLSRVIRCMRELFDLFVKNLIFKDKKECTNIETNLKWLEKEITVLSAYISGGRLIYPEYIPRAKKRTEIFLNELYKVKQHLINYLDKDKLLFELKRTEGGI
jgi:hypothetical protein